MITNMIYEHDYFFGNLCCLTILVVYLWILILWSEV